jgi:hypothetical protein
LFGIVQSLSALLAEDAALDVVDVVELVVLVQPNVLTTPRRTATLNHLVCIRAPDLLTGLELKRGIMARLARLSMKLFGSAFHRALRHSR